LLKRSGRMKISVLFALVAMLLAKVFSSNASRAFLPLAD
jgi:hypothetical protein